MPFDKLTADDLFVLRHIYKQYRRDQSFGLHSAASLRHALADLGIPTDPAIPLEKLAAAGLLTQQTEGDYILSPEGLMSASEL